MGLDHVYVYLHLKDQKSMLEPLKLELQAVGSYPVCRLGVELRSPRIACS